MVGLWSVFGTQFTRWPWDPTSPIGIRRVMLLQMIWLFLPVRLGAWFPCSSYMISGSGTTYIHFLWVGFYALNGGQCQGLKFKTFSLHTIFTLFIDFRNNPAKG